MDLYLTRYDINMFEKFLNPSNDSAKRDEWLNKYNFIFDKYLKDGVNLPMDMKKRYCVLMMLYPMKSNEEKTFYRLDDNGKVGYLSKYLIKKAYSCNVPKAVIERYSNLKQTYKSVKSVSMSFNRGNTNRESLNRAKNELQSFTYMIIDICYDKNTRSGKLDNLLAD